MSVSWGTQYAKLKTNLRLAANRLRLLQKKKTEQAIKARTEIAEYLNSDKEDRARIRVETIIREDFVVEAYELLEIDLDDGIAEAVSSLLWVAPRFGHEISEFKAISDELTHKYGKQFAEAARMNQLPEPSRVSPKLVQKLSVNAPSKLLVEKYLITIAQSAGIDFTPDPKVMRDDDDEVARAERNLINFMNEEQYGWNVKPGDGRSINGGTGPGSDGGFSGGGGSSTLHADNVSTISSHCVGGNTPGGTISKNEDKTTSNSYPSLGIPPPEYAPPPPMVPQQFPPGYGNNIHPIPNSNAALYPQSQQNFDHPHYEHVYETVPPTGPTDTDEDFLLPKFPEPPKGIPSHFPGNVESKQMPPTTKNGAGGSGNPNDDLDFDALARRFEELKKRI
uniref:IST1 homolog n=1 Tax=Meloidogyne hapla TaxID=6305 RepID=A0A1I8B2U7_MELHA